MAEVNDTTARDAKLGNLAALKQLSQTAKEFVHGIIGNIVGTVADAISEVHDVKADKTQKIALNISTSGWALEDNATKIEDFPYYKDIVISGLTSNDVVDFRIAPSSLSTTASCGFCPSQESFAGKVRFRSYSIPESSISGEYTVGKAYEATVNVENNTT